MPQRRCVVGQHLQVRLGGEARGLPRLRLEVEYDELAGSAGLQGDPELGHQQVRDHAGEPGARAEDDPVGRLDRLQRLRAGGRVDGVQGDVAHPAAGGCHLHLAADRGRSPGLAGSAPSTSAEMSSGTVAIGSTRPRAPSRRATQSRPSTWSPRSCHSATMSRLPRACSSISPSLRNRCWSTRAQVLPHSSSPQSAESACRRSPGGRQPNSLTQPPGRAAVVGDRDHGGQVVDDAPQRARATRPGRARRRARPTLCVSSTGSLPPEVAVRCLGVQPVLGQPRGDLLRHRDAAVLSAGAADRRRS